MNDTSESYMAITRRSSGGFGVNDSTVPAVHCEALTGKLVIGGRCWGAVELVEQRLLGRAVPRCQGHKGPRYRPEPGAGLEVPGDPQQLLHAMRSADDVMRIAGWQLLDASANLETGFLRLVAESRDQRAGEGVKLTLLRSTARSRVVIERSRVVWRSGFYRSAWEVDAPLGLDRVDGLGEAVETALHYVCDNSASGVTPPQIAARRREMFARHFAMLAPTRYSGAAATHSLDGEPLTERWAAECERTCCRGDGWDPYIPSVTASDCHGRRWVSTSGLIVDGRGVHREGTYTRGPLL